MKITIENTSKIVTFNGITNYVWQGKTESGIKVHCYITRIVIAKEKIQTEEFKDDLRFIFEKSDMKNENQKSNTSNVFVILVIILIIVILFATF